MQFLKANQESSPKDFEWYLLGEYSLSRLLPDPEQGDQRTAGLLSQAVQELGVPIECVENIEMILTRFAQEALAKFKQGRVEPPVCFRIFCQKRMISEAMKGGWGYFLIERSRELSAGCSLESSNIIDLFLYKEGEQSGGFG